MQIGNTGFFHQILNRNMPQLLETSPQTDPPAEVGDIYVFGKNSGAHTEDSEDCSAFSVLTQLVTGTRASHVAIVVPDGNLLEAVPNKVREITLKDKIDNYNGKVYHCVLTKEARTKIMSHLGEFKKCENQDLGAPYSSKEMYKVALNKVTGLFGELKSSPQDGFCCSQLVGHILKSTGVVSNKINPDLTTPSEIFRLEDSYSAITEVK